MSRSTRHAKVIQGELVRLLDNWDRSIGYGVIQEIISGGNHRYIVRSLLTNEDLYLSRREFRKIPERFMQAILSKNSALLEQASKKRKMIIRPQDVASVGLAITFEA